jgi:uncharacterized protein YecT (DUF1311 family)
LSFAPCNLQVEEINVFKHGIFLALILIVILCQPFFSVAAQREGGGYCDEAETTVEMQMCLGQRLEKARDLMESRLNRLMSCLNSGQQEQLREAQKAWLLFRDRSAAFEASGEEGGALFLLEQLAFQIEMTEDRVRELDRLYLRFANKVLNKPGSCQD